MIPPPHLGFNCSGSILQTLLSGCPNNKQQHDHQPGHHRYSICKGVQNSIALQAVTYHFGY